MKKLAFGCFVLAVSFIAFRSNVAIAQIVTTGTVSGTVTDESGATVPEVKLTLRNADTGETREALTSADGLYRFTLVPPGNYNLTAQRQGFKTITVTGLKIQVTAHVRQDFVMEVAAITEEVTVAAAPLGVNSEAPTLGEVMESRQIQELPLNGRNFLQLAQLTTGVNPPAVSNNENITSGPLGGRRPNLTVSISGVREVSATFLFDGIPSKHDFFGGVGTQPAVDAIEEFKIQRGYFSPQFGGPGIVNVVIKSGTNEFHGAAWEFLRNDVFDARNFFDPVKRPFRQNQFGVAAGGPILKNKLFVFGDYEGLRIRRSFTGLGIVPTLEMLRGDFRGLPTIYDPATFDPATGQRKPFPDNIIPAERIHPFAKKYLRFIPAPNATGPFNLVGETKLIENDNKFDIRVDLLISERDKFFSRFSYANLDQLQTTITPFGGTVVPFLSRSAVAAWTHTFSPRLLNDFRVGLDRVFLFSGTPEKARESPNWPGELGLRNLNDIPDCNGVPPVILAGFTTFGGPANCGITGNSDYHFLDNLSYDRGRHNITTGFEIIRIWFRDIGANTPNGAFWFTGQFTNSGDPTRGSVRGGSPVADYLLGHPMRVSGSKPTSPFYYSGTWWSVYINDNFRMTKNLTLNIGLRYEYTQPLVEKYNRIARFDWSTGRILLAARDGNPRSLITPDRNDFAPRVGLAWRPLGKDNWALRASYGIFYDRLPGNEWLWQSGVFQPSFSPVSGPVVPTIDISGLFPDYTLSLVGISLFNLDDRRSPYLQQWTLSSQHTLPGNLFFEIAYVASKGTKLSKRVDMNTAPNPPAPGDTRPLQQRRRYPNFGFILSDHGMANSWYHGLQLTVKKALAHGISFLAGYTWAKSLDNDSKDSKTTRNYRLQDLDKGRSIFDVRHRFTASFIYDLPSSGLQGVAKQFLGGWQLSGILSFQTGLPFHVTTSIDRSNTGVSFASRPNRICDGNLPSSQRRPERWFDTNCFVLPAPNTYGNAGVHYLDTDGVKTVDFAIFKNFPISERAKVQFRSEFFNLFNSVNFGRPDSGLESRAFSRVSSALDPRIIQFGLKFLW